MTTLLLHPAPPAQDPAPADAGTFAPDTPPGPTSASTGTFRWLDALNDAVLVLDATARVRHANRAAWRRMVPHAGQDGDGPPGLEDWLDAQQTRAVRDALVPGQSEALRHEAWTLSRLDPQQWVLVLRCEASRPRAAAPQAAAPMPTLPLADPALRGLHGMLWDSPFPATLQDESFRFVDVNAAYAQLVGWPRERLIGRDPIDLQLPADHAQTLGERAAMAAAPEDPQVPALADLRLVDGGGQVHWVRSARYLALTQDHRRLVLSLMQETTAEHAAREQAAHSSRELDQWFDLSPLGMVLFDDGGLVLRANVAFEAMVGGPLIELREAPAQVQALLHWSAGRLDIALESGGPWVGTEGRLALPDGSTRWVRVLLRCYEARSGHPRYMGMIEDRTAEEERDLAQQQLGALVDTAGIGLASIGGAAASAPVASDPAAGAVPNKGVALQAIRRELVLPSSLPEFERLQRALRQGERCEARYAIDHPEMGTRWLVTRVEPGRLASGRLTTSVVTLDVTEQQRAQERAEHLLAELGSILESSPAGIASMRGFTLMHCNRRFEHMLRLPAGAAVGSDIRALLATRARGLPEAHALAQALEHDALFDAEIEVRGDEGESNWYALTVHRSGGQPAPGEAPQAIAVLSEITRLKAQQRELEALASERAHMAQVLGQQADRTRAVLDSVLVGIVTVDEHGVISWLNRSARRMFGGDLGDFLGQPVDAVATEDDYHPFTRSHTLLADLRDGEAVKFECRVRARDGRTFWVVGNAVATLGTHGARELTYALMDIEQRRQAEARVAEARASLQRIIEAAPMAITLWDAQTLEAQQMNRVAAQLAQAQGTLMGRTPLTLYPTELGERILADLRASLADPGTVLQREYVVDRPGHARQTWDARFMALMGRDAVPAQLLMVATDVTDQRAAQRAELEAAIAQREMLVQEVHHRIKNNLQGVAGLMQQVAARRPEVQPVITEVVGQVQAIAQVYGLQVGKVGSLRLHSVVQAIAQSVQRTFGRTIVFDRTGPEAPDWTLPEAESIPIALTLNELLTNAVKHSPAGAVVRCGLQTDDGGATIEIANMGCLPTDFQLDQRRGGMSGLGLVRSLLPRRQAALTLTQRGEEVVARVSLSLPVVQRGTATAAAAQATAMRD